MHFPTPAKVLALERIILKIDDSNLKITIEWKDHILIIPYVTLQMPLNST